MSARRRLDTRLSVVIFSRIQVPGAGRIAVHDSFPNPTFRMFPTGCFQRLCTLFQDLSVHSGMPDGRLNPIDSAMASFMVVMTHKLFEPTPRIFNFEETVFGVTSGIFQRLEERFGVRIIIADTRATMGIVHPESIEYGKSFRSFHRCSIVGMKHELPLPDSITDEGLREKFSGIFRVICLINSVVYNAPAVDVDDRICVEKTSFEAAIP